MAVIIGSARIDERGRISGGQAGDQTGNEVGTQNWYKHSKGWRVLRAKDPAKRKLIAKAMRAACDNNKIGYDQTGRNSLYNQVKDKGFDPAKATTACETDCSALVRVCCCYARIIVGDFITSNLAKLLLATGKFTELTDSKYTDKSDYLRVGDVLVTKTKGHTVVALTNGAKCENVESNDSTPKVTITGNSVNIRDMPSTDYGKIIGKCDKGDTLPYIGLESTDGWRAVKIDGRYGWVSGKYSKVQEG